VPETGRRLTNEVEITPEMIEAGSRVLYDLPRGDLDLLDRSEVVARILFASLHRVARPVLGVDEVVKPHAE
jgi:hypothetical protein